MGNQALKFVLQFINKSYSFTQESLFGYAFTKTDGWVRDKSTCFKLSELKMLLSHAKTNQTKKKKKKVQRFSIDSLTLGSLFKIQILSWHCRYDSEAVVLNEVP